MLLKLEPILNLEDSLMLTGLRMSIIIMVAEAFHKAKEEEIRMVSGIIMHNLEIIKAEVDMLLTMPITLVLTMEILVASLMEKVL